MALSEYGRGGRGRRSRTAQDRERRVKVTHCGSVGYEDTPLYLLRYSLSYIRIRLDTCN